MSSTLACTLIEATLAVLIGAASAVLIGVVGFVIYTGRQVVTGQRKPYR